MPKRQIFYSFHYVNDCWRTQIVRNIGSIEGNTPVSANEWEEVKRQGSDAVRRWIDNAMYYRSLSLSAQKPPIVLGFNTR